MNKTWTPAARDNLPLTKRQREVARRDLSSLIRRFPTARHLLEDTTRFAILNQKHNLTCCLCSLYHLVLLSGLVDHRVLSKAIPGLMAEIKTEYTRRYTLGGHGYYLSPVARLVARQLERRYGLISERWHIPITWTSKRQDGRPSDPVLGDKGCLSQEDLLDLGIPFVGDVPIYTERKFNGARNYVCLQDRELPFGPTTTLAAAGVPADRVVLWRGRRLDHQVPLAEQDVKPGVTLQLWVAHAAVVLGTNAQNEVAALHSWGVGHEARGVAVVGSPTRWASLDLEYELTGVNEYVYLL